MSLNIVALIVNIVLSFKEKQFNNLCFGSCLKKNISYKHRVTVLTTKIEAIALVMFREKIPLV